jgi:ABC-type sugar transport system ATPase subunit
MSSSMSQTSVVVQMKGIDKRYPGVHALDHVGLDARQGEIHALIGENGAGKSTLMKVLAGAIVPDEGTIALDGKEVTFRTPIDALRAGVSTIYQEFMLCSNLDVASNIFLGRERARGAFVREDEQRAESSRYLQLLHLDIEPRRLVGDLPVAQQQLIEIAKALALESRVIVMDEPTAVLTARETDELFAILKRLRGEGRTIVYISHRMEEIFELADRATVLRDGKLVGTVDVADVDESTLVRMMVGRELETVFERRAAADHGPVDRHRTPALEVRDLALPGRFEDVSFAVAPGEVVGMAGLVGAGRTEVLRAIFGLEPSSNGTILRDGDPVAIRQPHHAIAVGIGMTTEDRKRDGLFSNWTVRNNLSVADLPAVSSGPFIQPRAERGLAFDLIKRLDIRPPTPDHMMVNLSGGNQQKVTIGRWLATDPDVLLLDEPTRGVDVGAKVAIRELIRGLADQGKAILVVSSELPELLATADRILVMRAGRLVAELDAATTTQEEIATHAVSSQAEPPDAQPAQHEGGVTDDGR